jgi:hypothetical protein
MVRTEKLYKSWGSGSVRKYFTLSIALRLDPVPEEPKQCEFTLILILLVSFFCV